MWKMLHDANAIEAMAISFKLAEPLGNMLAKRMQRELETSASIAGLSDKVPLQGFQVNLANPAEVLPITGAAMLFQQTSMVRTADDTVQKQLTSQLEMQTTHLTYQTWRYSSWSEEIARCLKIALPGLLIACQGAAIGAVRLEYLDRFYFEGEAENATVSEVLQQQSKWLAPHVFESNTLWHLHTGRFVNGDEFSRTLLLANVDQQDMTGPDPRFAGRRAVQLVTAAEKQFLGNGREVSGEAVEPFISSTLGDLHTSVIDLFKQIVNQKFAKDNGLPS